MRPVDDIRDYAYKQQLRERYKNQREDIDPSDKAEWDGAIFHRLTQWVDYQEAELVLAYVSMDREVDTRDIIRHALGRGKMVGVPRCPSGCCEMEFYRICSMDGLAKSAFGVLEPDPLCCEPIVFDEKTDFSQAVCLVPGLCFDEKGYRLGYGKGYYDRFLAGFHGTSIGLCYAMGIRSHLVHGMHDQRVDKIVTERKIINTESQ